jgi:hypothetical protein
MRTGHHARMADVSSLLHERDTPDLVARDPRADRGIRTISFMPDVIRIARQRDGVAMRIAVPYTSYRGVALAISTTTNATRYAIVLVHDDLDLCVTLAIVEEEIVARRKWIAIARGLRVARLVKSTHGGFVALDAPAGALTIKQPVARRRGKPTRNRRPLFAQRRRCGSRAPTRVHRDEREIIARE